MNHHLPEVKKQLAALKMLQGMFPHRVHVVLRPQLRNVPNCDGELCECVVCGRGCWKMKHEPEPLPNRVVAMCSECGMRAGSIYANSGNEMTHEEVVSKLKQRLQKTS